MTFLFICINYYYYVYSPHREADLSNELAPLHPKVVTVVRVFVVAVFDVKVRVVRDVVVRVVAVFVVSVTVVLVVVDVVIVVELDVEEVQVLQRIVHLCFSSVP